MDNGIEFTLFLQTLSFILFLVLSSRALAPLSDNGAYGMGFANCIDTDDRSREGSVRTRAEWLTFAQIFPGRSFAPTFAGVIYFAKPIPFVRVF